MVVKKKISEHIEEILESLYNNDKALSDILLTVKHLAYEINKPELKEWVNNEINGYKSKEVPEYRYTPCTIHLKLIQYCEPNIITTNKVLQPEYLDESIRPYLSKLKITTGAGALEDAYNSKNNSIKKLLPLPLPNDLLKIIPDDSEVSSAYLTVGPHAIKELLDKIRSTLMDLLLELKGQFVDNDDLYIGEHKKEEIEEPNRDNLSSNPNTTTYNVTNTIYASNNSKINVGTGENVNQQIQQKNEMEELQEFIKYIKEYIKNNDLQTDNKNNISEEITDLETQLQIEKPKKDIIKQGLSKIKKMLENITGNTLTSMIVEKLSEYIGRF